MKQSTHRGLYGIFARRAREPMSSYTHLVGAVASAFAAAALSLYCGWSGGSALRTAAVAVFGLSLTALYAASAAYHFYNRGDAGVCLRLRKLDHAMIYVLIAGSYTPFLICAMGAQARGRLLLIWGVAALGIAVKLLWLDAPRWLSTAFYLALGWFIVLIPDALAHMPAAVIALTAAGGAAYTAGAVIYAVRRPNFGATWGFHEIFHLFILLGSLLHVVAVFIFLALA